MHRFFITGEAWDGNKVVLEGEQSHQIMRVLRMHPGEHIILLDNSGWEFEVKLDEVTHNLVSGTLLEKRCSYREPQIQLALFQSLLKRDNFEWVLQKCTEIGIAHFFPTINERTVRQDQAGKMDRWGKIVREAAEQSGRTRLPIISAPLRFTDALEQANKTDCSFIAWEGETTLSLGLAVTNQLERQVPASLALIVGPEGGFTKQEIEQVRDRGIVPVSLGKRILRSETAAVAASAIIFHILEEHESIKQ